MYKQENKMKHNITDYNFYHIYPLGMCGAPKQNDFSQAPGNCIKTLTSKIDYLLDLGINAIYIGPLFESTAHGYDTVDYYWVDRRLGTNDDLKKFVNVCHQNNFCVILDAVFNHTGRDFFAFKDLQNNGLNSQYKDWYKNVRFDQRSPMGDNFSYENWAGCNDLVKLNVDNPQVQEHLFGAVEHWINTFDIDGLRLDAADVLSPNFMEKLSIFCQQKKQDFLLMGEVVHGDYNNWAKPGRLDSVTNYQIYKSLWSAFNSGNMHELGYNLNREVGDGGIYKNFTLYNFLDNHDVNRIASTVTKQEYLYPLYGLLYTIPGVPSIYYGSEYGIRGVRNQWGDSELRPSVPPFCTHLPEFARPATNSSSLQKFIRKLSHIRKEYKSLRNGNYKQIGINMKQLAFLRSYQDEDAIIAVNSDSSTQKLSLNNFPAGNYYDALNDQCFTSEQLKNIEIPAAWLRILIRK